MPQGKKYTYTVLNLGPYKPLMQILGTYMESFIHSIQCSFVKLLKKPQPKKTNKQENKNKTKHVNQSRNARDMASMAISLIFQLYIIT